jgi:hypothetical protein
METVIVASSPVSGQCCAILCGAPNLFRQVQRFLIFTSNLSGELCFDLSEQGGLNLDTVEA